MVVDVLVQVADVGEARGDREDREVVGVQASISSQRTGVETRASGKPRTE